jgi:primosomal protein N'
MSECENCDAEMTYDTESKCYVCQVCGFSAKDKSDEKEVKYVG